MTFKTKENRVLELIKSYEEINKYSCNFKKINITLVHMQENYFSFYEKWKDLNFDELVIELTDSNISNGLLRRLYTFIKKHINLYKSTEDDFKNLNITDISKFSTNWYFQHKIDLLNSEKESIKANFYRTESEKELLLEENNFELFEVIKEDYHYTNKINEWFSDNYHTKIYDLSNNFLAILDIYIIKSNNSGVVLEKDKNFFSTGFTYQLWKTTNDKQFVKISDTEFFNSINLLTKPISLRIKGRQRVKVCYIVSELFKHMQHEEKSYWKSEICKQLNIEDSITKRPSLVKKDTNKQKTDQNDLIDEIKEIIDKYNINFL